MANQEKLQDGDFIEMDISMAGDASSWAPGQILRVGTDIDAGRAQAFVTALGGDEPRAHVVTEQQAHERLSRDPELEQMRTEAPPRRAEDPARDLVQSGDDEPELLGPVFEACLTGQAIVLDEPQRAAAQAFVDEHPDDERSIALTQLLAAEPEKASITLTPEGDIVREDGSVVGNVATLEPVFAAIGEGQHGIILDEDERAVVAAFVEAKPDDERAPALTALLAKGTDVDEDEQRDQGAQTNGGPADGETRPAPEAQTRETATQKRRRGKVTPPEEPDKT